jgi:diguanylate cyclase (GGDEF)-like protein/PAS domain S-box-containing protein
MEHQGAHVLILDDEEHILDVLGQHLSSEGYKCTLCSSPREATELIKDEPFALLLTDLKMPEMDGMEVVRFAKEVRPEMAIIVVTALVEVTNAIQAIRIGAEDYVLKPFNLTEISAAVFRALDKKDLATVSRLYQDELEHRVDAATQDLESVNRQHRETKEYLERLLESTVDGILTIDGDLRIEFANGGAQQMLGFTNEELVGTEVVRLVVGGSAEVRRIWGSLEEKRPLRSHEMDLRCKDGSMRPVSVSLSLVPGVEGKAASALAICKDITEQKELQQELREISIKDSLTGLYNQRCFYDRLESEVERARRQKHPLSLLLFDLDQFKKYNDAHGHLEGDNVLQVVGEVVNECTREHVDIGCRYGGDEFTVILPEAGEDQAYNIAERIRATFEARHFDHLTVSMGILTYKEDFTVRSFMQFADQLMYDAKRSGGNRVEVYRPDEAKEKASH